MIRPLRRVHRAAFTILVVALPAVLVAVLLARPDTGAITAPVDETWSIRIDRPHAVVDRPPSTPEVLAYLEPDAAAIAPGPASRFLGALTGARTTFEIPADAKGQLLLYSPALQRSPARQALP